MRHPFATASALVFAACLTVVPDLSRPVSFGVFAVVFVAIVAGALRSASPLAITARPGALVGVAAVWIALGVGFVASPTFDGLLRIGAFVVFTGAALFVLPSFVARRATYRAITIIAAAFAVLGVITAFVGPVGTLDIYHRTSLAGVAYYTPLSLFGNPNILGSVGLVGALAAAGIAVSRDMADTTQNRGGAAILCSVCVLAVVLSESRAALLALIAGGGVLIVARSARPRTTAAVTLCGLAALVGVLGLAAAVGISFSGRFDLWAAAISATAERPLFGWGPGAGADALAAFLPDGSRYAGFSTHNSYLRMFFIGGLIGGIGYLLLSVSALRGALDADPTTLGLVIAVLVFFVFETGTVFGLAPISFVGALAFGYAQHHGAGDGSPPSIAHSPTVWRWDVGRALTSSRR